MKLIQSSPDVIKYVSALLSSPFIYIDVGCAYNGIDKPLYDFGDKLLAYGFDANAGECERLTENNTNQNINFIHGIVRLDPLHPLSIARKNNPYWRNNPWKHLTVARSLESDQEQELSNQEKISLNLWDQSKFEKPPELIYLNEFLPANGIENIDLCKIDVDGEDFDILHSLEEYFVQKRILSIVVEVNYFGTDNEYEHTFHNVDRFLRKHGFDLYGLTVNRYSSRSLPSPYYFNGPGENVSGRPYQGDALYILNPFEENNSPNRDNFLKLIAIYALFNLPDWAAELLQTFGEEFLAPDIHRRMLDLLSNQIQGADQRYPSYESYINAFNEKDPYFYNAQSINKQVEIEKLQAEISALKCSTSWRITSLFRYISRLIKSLS